MTSKFLSIFHFFEISNHHPCQLGRFEGAPKIHELNKQKLLLLSLCSSRVSSIFRYFVIFWESWKNWKGILIWVREFSQNLCFVILLIETVLFFPWSGIKHLLGTAFKRNFGKWCSNFSSYQKCKGGLLPQCRCITWPNQYSSKKNWYLLFELFIFKNLQFEVVW